VKLVSETSNPKPILLIIFARALPKALPMTRVGTNTPPTPPAPKVVVIAMDLKIVIPNSNAITIQILLKSKLKGVLPIAAKWSPLSKLFIIP